MGYPGNKAIFEKLKHMNPDDRLRALRTDPRLAETRKYAEQHGIKLVTISDKIHVKGIEDKLMHRGGH